MRKYIVFLLLCMVLLTGCKNSGAAPSADMTKELEPYEETVEEKESSPYQYLVPVNLSNESVAVKTFLPNGKDLTQEDTKASASMDGISVELEVVQETEENTVGSYLDKAYTKESKRIQEIEGMQDFKVFDLIEEEDYWLLEMDYNKNDGNGTLYPCISILKMDRLGDGFYLLSILRVDNEAANEETKEVLQEIMEVYGVNIAEK